MGIIAALVGFAAGFVAWCIGSYLVSLFIYWGATRVNPFSEKTLKALEVTLCGLTFALSVGVFIGVSLSLWPEPA